jgi:hypothetical protein
MVERTVPGFLPSRHGLRFANAFPPGPTLRLGPLDTRLLGIGDASQGLCGGMALTARDLWAAGLESPADQVEPPANGSPRFRALVRRQVESLDWLRVPLRYLDLQAFRPDPPGGLAARLGRELGREPARVVAVGREWPRIRAEIDAGRPCVVGLIRVSGSSPWLLSRNHQVLAWAYSTEEAAARSTATIRLRVYDPNHPGRDDVALLAEVDGSDGRPVRERIRLRQSTGEPLFGWFRQPYPPPHGVRAWRRT